MVIVSKAPLLREMEKKNQGYKLVVFLLCFTIAAHVGWEYKTQLDPLNASDCLQTTADKSEDDTLKEIVSLKKELETVENTLASVKDKESDDVSSLKKELESFKENIDAHDSKKEDEIERLRKELKEVKETIPSSDGTKDKETKPESAQEIYEAVKVNHAPANQNEVVPEEEKAAFVAQTNDYRELWTPITAKEKEDLLGHNCTSRFQHCCVGQCRQSKQKHPNIDDLLLKWTEPTATFAGDILAQVEKRKVVPEKSCNFFFLGDSLTSDTSMGAVCELEKAGYELTSCLPAFGDSVSYGRDLTIECEESNIQVPHFTFKNDEAESCKEVVITFLNPFPYSSYQQKTVRKGAHDSHDFDVNQGLHDMIYDSRFENGFVTIFNWALHCKEVKKCIRNIVETHFIPFVNDPTFSHWDFLFTEHEPQHFNTDQGGGHFLRDRINDPPCTDLKGKADNWKNAEIALVIEDNGLADTVPIIKIFDKMEPLYGAHCSHLKDCSHYAYSPYRFQVKWDAMMDALLALKDRVK